MVQPFTIFLYYTAAHIQHTYTIIHGHLGNFVKICSRILNYTALTIGTRMAYNMTPESDYADKNVCCI